MGCSGFSLALQGLVKRSKDPSRAAEPKETAECGYPDHCPHRHLGRCVLTERNPAVGHQRRQQQQPREAGTNAAIHHRTPNVRIDRCAEAFRKSRATLSNMLPRRRLASVVNKGPERPSSATPTVPAIISAVTTGILNFRGIPKRMAIHRNRLYTSPGTAHVAPATPTTPMRLSPDWNAAAVTTTSRTAAGGRSRESTTASRDSNRERI